jgi:hypothetical protein
MSENDDWDVSEITRPWAGSYDVNPPIDPATLDSVDTGASRFTGTEGIMVYGLTLAGASGVISEPMYFSWAMLDELIISGALKAGAFDSCRVTPLPGTWPAKYRDLKRV